MTHCRGRNPYFIQIQTHYYPINSLSLGERVGVRDRLDEDLLIFHPLILTFSLREKGFVELLDEHHIVLPRRNVA